jgi:hypothetical protein
MPTVLNSWDEAKPGALAAMEATRAEVAKEENGTAEEAAPAKRGRPPKAEVEVVEDSGAEESAEGVAEETEAETPEPAEESAEESEATEEGGSE